MGMYNKGQKAQQQAAAHQAAMEAARQQRVQEALNAIQGVFNDPQRQQMYDQQRDAVFQLNQRELTSHFDDASKRLQYGLFRSGLNGSGVALDEQGKLSKRLNEGLMKVRSAADQAAAGLRAEDERTRQQLATMAQSGIDTGNMASMAANAANANLQSANASRQIQGLDSLFGDIGTAYMASQQRAAMNPYQGNTGMAPGGNVRQGYSGSTYKG